MLSWAGHFPYLDSEYHGLPLSSEITGSFTSRAERQGNQRLCFPKPAVPFLVEPKSIQLPQLFGPVYILAHTQLPRGHDYVKTSFPLPQGDVYFLVVPFLRLPDLANESIGCLGKFEVQINDNFLVYFKYYMII